MLKTVLGPARGISLAAGDVSELSEVRDMLANLVTELEQTWLKQGVQQGVAIGEARGEALALIRLVEKRFGPLEADLRDRIMAADSGTVEAWFDRAIDAPSRDAVFAERPVN
jgi:hypothetical protein